MGAMSGVLKLQIEDGYWIGQAPDCGGVSANQRSQLGSNNPCDEAHYANCNVAVVDIFGATPYSGHEDHKESL